jgi:hypothetical protein
MVGIVSEEAVIAMSRICLGDNNRAVIHWNEHCIRLSYLEVLNSDVIHVPHEMSNPRFRS